MLPGLRRNTTPQKSQDCISCSAGGFNLGVMFLKSGAVEGALGIRPVDQIEAIINRDKKVATYKLALLRALCEISQVEYRNVQWHNNNRVSIPLGLIVEKWLFYYWPLIESETHLPQIRGNSHTKQIAFRKDLVNLVNYFRKSGGISAFDVAYRSNKLLPEGRKLLLSSIRSIAVAIVNGPIRYAGGAIEGIDRVFEYQGHMRIAAIQRMDIPVMLTKGGSDCSSGQGLL